VIQKGIAHLLLIVVVVIIGIGAVGYLAYQNTLQHNESSRIPITATPSYMPQEKDNQISQEETNETNQNWGTKEETTKGWITHNPEELGVSFNYLPEDPDADCGVIKIEDSEVYIAGCDFTIVQITKLPFTENDLLTWWSNQTDEPDRNLLTLSGGITPSMQFDPVIFDNIEYRYSQYYEDLDNGGKYFGNNLLMLNIKDEYVSHEYDWYGNKRYYYLPHDGSLLKIVTGYSVSTDFLIESLQLH
jgi:hypothetical protein